jgi:hypothetical protein
VRTNRLREVLLLAVGKERGGPLQVEVGQAKGPVLAGGTYRDLVAVGRAGWMEQSGPLQVETGQVKILFLTGRNRVEW